MYMPDKFQACQPKVIVLKFIQEKYGALGVYSFPLFNAPKLSCDTFLTYVILPKQLGITPFALALSSWK